MSEEGVKKQKEQGQRGCGGSHPRERGVMLRVDGRKEQGEERELCHFSEALS